jgi:hypothetical protein
LVRTGEEEGHPVHAALAAHVDASELSPEQKAHYKAALAHVLSNVPQKGLDRIHANVKHAVFHPDARAVGLAACEAALRTPVSEGQKAKIAATLAAVRDGKVRIGGAYVRNRAAPELHLDGDFATPGAAGAHGGDQQAAAEVYAHELAHAIDGPGNVASSSTLWQRAYEAEIGPRSDKGGGPRLCRYAQTDQHEGWAEFGRLVYGGRVPLVEVERQFPQCTYIWKSAGIWPS